MTIQISKNPIKQDLSLLAIEAAEELERGRRKLDTDFKSVKDLSIVLKESFSQKAEESDDNYRLDHVSVFSRAISNSFGPSVTIKTISELVHEADRIASSLLNSDTINSKEDELQKLISFCVALSDSAALYKEELEELKKHFA